ncbi:MAG: S41 family peptidase [Patescibacteria group bacterium]
MFKIDDKTRNALCILSILVSLLMGYWLGVTRGYYHRITNQNLLAAWQQEISNYREVTPSFSLYEDVISLLQEKYYGDIDQLNLLYGSIKGAVDSLGDHYTSFSTPAESKEFFTNLNGIYEGIGVEMDDIDGQLVVITPMEGSPAQKAGIKPRDTIMAIDGRITIGLGLDGAVQLIQGARGSQVTLIISREGEANPLEFVVTRGLIKIPSVTLVSFEDQLAVIEITKFSSDTEKLFRNVVSTIVKGGVTGIVLDLRNNPGGFLDVGVKVVNEFMFDGMIVEERFKDGRVTPFYADGSGKLSDIPVVVLVNDGSASAAEILAGALKDNGRATIVGTNTYGKGSVQEIEEMPDGSALRITVAHWYTPSGKSISQGGIKPDILIEEGQDEATDVQLDKAIEELKKLIK